MINPELTVRFSIVMPSILQLSFPNKIRRPFFDPLAAIKRGNPDLGQLLPDRFSIALQVHFKDFDKRDCDGTENVRNLTRSYINQHPASSSDSSRIPFPVAERPVFNAGYRRLLRFARYDRREERQHLACWQGSVRFREFQHRPASQISFFSWQNRENALLILPVFYRGPGNHA